MLDNTNDTELSNRTQEIEGRHESLETVPQAMNSRVGSQLGEESLYVDESGAMVARNPRFSDEPAAERMDILVLERADGRPVLEISALVPEHFAGCHLEAKTQMAQYVPDTQDFAAISFGDEDPAAVGLASVKPDDRAAAAVRVSTQEIGLTIKKDDTTSSLRLFEDRAEISVPFRFAVADQAPSEPLAGLVYFDATEKGLRVYDGSDWIAIG